MQGLLLCLVGVLLVGCGDGGHKNVPRSRTLVMDCSSLQDCSGQIKDYNSFNPFLLTGVSKTGWNFQYEPLYFYNAYNPHADNIIPWIATGHEYNEDYTEVIYPHPRGGRVERWAAVDGARLGLYDQHAQGQRAAFVFFHRHADVGKERCGDRRSHG